MYETSLNLIETNWLKKCIIWEEAAIDQNWRESEMNKYEPKRKWNEQMASKNTWVWENSYINVIIFIK